MGLKQRLGAAGEGGAGVSETQMGRCDLAVAA